MALPRGRGGGGTFAWFCNHSGGSWPPLSKPRLGGSLAHSRLSGFRPFGFGKTLACCCTAAGCLLFRSGSVVVVVSFRASSISACFAGRDPCPALLLSTVLRRLSYRHFLSRFFLSPFLWRFTSLFSSLDAPPFARSFPSIPASARSPPCPAPCGQRAPPPTNLPRPEATRKTHFRFPPPQPHLSVRRVIPAGMMPGRISQSHRPEAGLLLDAAPQAGDTRPSPLLIISGPFHWPRN